ncbi:MAG: glutamine amidotransferase [Coriobacteriales bacterium]|jgi:CobQ-like glutamine amidotransferase family enzyme|nr:glutamine amidotransferase [Coriobacteriales bacterium]
MALSTAEPLVICHLYPLEMNIYGDHGNVQVLVRRCELRGIPVRVEAYHPRAAFPARVDLLVGGGGQDSGQVRVKDDLPRVAGQLRELVASGVPALVVCGTYQLFGKRFITVAGEDIEGIGVFDLHTVGGAERMIGNIAIETSKFGTVIGYENHSGATLLGVGAQPFGTVTSGMGNNGDDGTEGVFSHNAIGTYLHGPLLPKNPRVADFLIAAALARRSNALGDGPGELAQELAPLDELDALAERARAVALTRPR